MTLFGKYHATRNDFVVVVDAPMSAERAVRLCDRHAGIGGDGVLQLLREGDAWRMRIYNSDGSVPEMCGNGFRCAIKHLVDRGLMPKAAPLSLITDAGRLAAEASFDAGGKVSAVRVDMGPPRSAPALLEVEALGRRFRGYTVSMGNPHFVLDADDPAGEAKQYGLALATHPAFALGSNIEFCRWRTGGDGPHGDLVVYERGAGLTMACGTGACAAVVVAQVLEKILRPRATVALPGGELTIEVDARGHVFMTGPAVWVFDVEVEEGRI